MEISLIVVLVTGVNLVVVCGMFVFVIKELGKRGQGNISEYDRQRSANNELLDKFSKLEAKLDEKPRTYNESEVRAPDADKPIDRINMAIEKLNRGNSPDSVCKELGYSRSEMGILQASARLGKIKIKQA